MRSSRGTAVSGLDAAATPSDAGPASAATSATDAIEYSYVWPRAPVVSQYTGPGVISTSRLPWSTRWPSRRTQ
jgi:hypothetical protein